MTNIPNVHYDMPTVLQDARVSEQSLNQSDVNYIKLGLGTTRVRILPPPVDPTINRQTPYLHVIKHFGLFDKDQKAKAVLCAMEKHGECPICEEWHGLQQVGTNESRDRAGKIKPSHLYVYTVLDAEGQIGLLSMDQKCQDAFLAQIASYSRRDASFNPFHLQSGRSVDINKAKGKGKGKYQPNIWTITFDLTATSVPAHILASYAKVYMWPEKMELTYTPADLNMALNGDWSFLEKYDRNAGFDTEELEAQQPPVAPLPPPVTNTGVYAPAQSATHTTRTVQNQMSNRMQTDLMNSILK